MNRKDISVAIFNTSDISGGAAKAACRLHHAFMKNGIRSRYFVRDARSRAPEVVGVGVGDWMRRQLDIMMYENYINDNRTGISSTYFSSSFFGSANFTMDMLADFRVVNLHWIEEFLSLDILKKLVASGKPVIWTLHDAKPFTGGCHYTAGCEKFMTDCRFCPQLQDDPYDLTANVLAAKKEILDQSAVTVVTPSRWLAGEARKSLVFRNCRVEVIPNAVDTDMFHPREENVLRKKYEIAPGAVVLKFGSCNNKETRKGFRYLYEAIQLGLRDERFRGLCEQGKVHIMTTGIHDPSLDGLGIPVKSMGYVENEQAMAELYTIADLFLLPSLEDNLPNTMLEAMACGTPVIGFDTGGIPDVVDEKCGRVVDRKDPRQLAAAVLDLVFDSQKRKTLGQEACQKIHGGYGLEHQAERYGRLMESLDDHVPVKKIQHLDLDFYEPIIGRSISKSMQKNETVLMSKKQLDDLQNEITTLNMKLHELRNSIQNVISISKYTNLKKKIEAYQEMVAVYHKLFS